MALLVCHVLQVLQEESGSGTRGDWVRRSVIVEHGEEYPRKLCVTAFSQEKADILPDLTPGLLDQMHVAFESREHNGRWFTDCRFVHMF